MVKDKVIWFGCGLLFILGAVWGANLKAEGFFRVANLHDLFDIFGATATTAAVVLAIIGLNRWRVEVGAASDHELARRLLVALLKYRLELEGLWNFADLASRQSSSEAWLQDQNEFSERVYKGAISSAQKSRVELEVIALECSAIWGGEYESGFDELFRFENVCANIVNSYLFLCFSRPVEEWFWANSLASETTWKEFNAGREDAVEVRIRNIIAPIYADVQTKLLRGTS